VGGTSDPLKSIADDISAAFGDLITSNQMTVRGNELWVEIELNSSLLVASADAMPSDQAFTIIDKVAAILKPFENPVHVEGFTDNLPISTAQYPTNWELSSARAASIVRMLAMQGVNPGRLATVGYGEFQPVDNNDHRGRTCAQPEGGAGGVAQPGCAPKPDRYRHCQCNTGCRLEAGWHTNCTSARKGAGSRECRQFSVTGSITPCNFSVEPVPAGRNNPNESLGSCQSKGWCR